MRNGRPVRQTGWARTAPVRALRECVQVVAVKNVMRKELSVEVYGLDELRALDGPALIVANHASHLDTAVLLSTLPAKRRRRTAVGVAGDYFFNSWFRSSASAIAFNTFPTPRLRAREHRSQVAGQRLDRGDLSRGQPFPRWVRRPVSDGGSGDCSCMSGPGHPSRDPGHVRGDASREQLAGARAAAGERAVWPADQVPAR